MASFFKKLIELLVFTKDCFAIDADDEGQHGREKLHAGEELLNS